MLEGKTKNRNGDNIYMRDTNVMSFTNKRDSQFCSLKQGSENYFKTLRNNIKTIKMDTKFIFFWFLYN